MRFSVEPLLVRKGDFLEWMAKWGLEPSPMGKGDRGAVEEVPVQSSASKRGELNVLQLELEESFPNAEKEYDTTGASFVVRLSAYL